jgi:hypothetical protein
MMPCDWSAGSDSLGSSAFRQHAGAALSELAVSRHAFVQQQGSLPTWLAGCRSAGQFDKYFPSAQMHPSTGQPFTSASGTIAHSAAWRSRNSNGRDARHKLPIWRNSTPIARKASNPVSSCADLNDRWGRSVAD